LHAWQYSEVHTNSLHAGCVRQYTFDHVCHGVTHHAL
jgi:hypothetical protein